MDLEAKDTNYIIESKTEDMCNSCVSINRELGFRCFNKDNIKNPFFKNKFSGCKGWCSNFLSQ
jgi:hypothetical protein